MVVEVMVVVAKVVVPVMVSSVPVAFTQTKLVVSSALEFKVVA